MIPSADRQAKGLRDAAGILIACSETGIAIQAGSDDRELGTLGHELARPVAAILLAAAGRISYTGTSLGLPVRNALEIAGLIVGEDLGASG